MNSTTLSRTALKQFSAFSHSFGNQSPFSSFIEQPFLSINDLHTQANKKKQHYSAESRAVLVQSLQSQLNAIASQSQLDNLKKLESENTFTITTGHQLTLFGGPLYLIYKVLHVVKLVESFNAASELLQAVPVFWMASEDHDLDEVRFTHLFNQKLVWETPQTGPVGRMSTNDLKAVVQQFSALFEGKETAIQDLLAIEVKGSYSDYCQRFLSVLFAAFGVLVIQPDQPELKELFIPVIERELNQPVSYNAVDQTNVRLVSAGLQPQAQARPCNLFLLKAGARLRIDPIENGFAIDGEVYSKEKILEMVRISPEQFSPNVILRPVFQETILPNLAYIGGGGEMAYWIQLKGVFDAHETVFPLIQQRNSVHLIDGGAQKRIDKLGWKTARFFEHKDQLRKEYLHQNDAEQLDMSAIEEQFQALRLALIQKSKSIDVSLESFAEAETVRMGKQIEQIEQRLVKQVKQQHEQALKSIDFVCDRFLPENQLQERYFHWLHFAPSGDYLKLMHEIYDAMDPFEADLILLKTES